MTRRLILAGDIGGTTTRLRRVSCESGHWQTIAERNYDSRTHSGLIEIVHKFGSECAGPGPEAACFAIAGPVRGEVGHEHVDVTNLPWEVNAGALASATGISQVTLINDFEAVGYAIDHLDRHDLRTLQEGEPAERGARAVLGAGTGLGQALLVSQAGTWIVVPTEGGHVDFGPRDELELELARWLIGQRGRASYEDILSGAGLVRLYSFLREHESAHEATSVADAMRQGDPAAAISRAALEDGDHLALSAVRLFVRIYGAQAGNLALTSGATGGVYVAGGIAPRLLPIIEEGGFLESFVDKDPMRAMMRRIPLHIVTATDIGLRGAVARACALTARTADTPPLSKRYAD